VIDTQSVDLIILMSVSLCHRQATGHKYESCCRCQPTGQALTPLVFHYKTVQIPSTRLDFGHIQNKTLLPFVKSGCIPRVCKSGGGARQTGLLPSRSAYAILMLGAATTNALPRTHIHNHVAGYHIDHIGESSTACWQSDLALHLHITYPSDDTVSSLDVLSLARRIRYQIEYSAVSSE